MIDRLLQSHLEPVARDLYRWRLWRGLAKCWFALGFVGLAAYLLQRSGNWSSPFTFFVLIVAGIVGAWFVSRNFRRLPLDYRAVARHIEEQNPELHALLLTAIEQVPAESGQLNYLQQRVILEALEYHRRNPWAGPVARRNDTARQLQWLGLLFFCLTLVGLRPHFHIRGSGIWSTAAHSNGISVTPGDASLERGSPLVVLARFDGYLPTEAQLIVTPQNENETRVPLSKNLADPVYGGGVPEVRGDLKYHVEYPRGKTRDFKITVFEYPRLDHADAKISYPAYTGLSDKTIKDVRRLSAVEGSSLDYSFFLNKPVVSATLVAKGQPAVPLAVDTNNTTVYRTQIKLEQNRRYELVLVDDAGRTNKLPPEFVLEALKNRAPDLKLASPRGDQRVSALEEIAFTGEASDDFGLQSYGIAYSLGGEETKVVELGQKSPAREKRQLSYTLPLESLGAQPDQLLSYYLWADDAGPDGQTRRTTTDMYFAEIKPFDEIYREGQGAEPSDNQNNQNNQNNGGQGGQQTPTERLTDLQKDVISATWNLKRRETQPKPSDKFKTDVQTIHDSQEQALDQVKQMDGQSDDARAKAAIDTAQKAMEKAANSLAEAADKNTSTPLTSAVNDEQAAYQALLRLSAREYQVTRNNGQRGQRGGQQQRGGQRAQRQLDQMDLRQQDNRYETQREANSQQNTEQQREQLQVANRLKELAQRQNDLNERIRELQSSLQEARTEQERQDIRDRLKRLRDEQQDLLADVDELRQRMDRPENQTRMNDERQQLDQTRSDVQRAAESLAQNSPSDALSSGTRAQREFQQLQDDFRKKNSDQFSEAMRQMRNDARQLAQNEQDIQKKLNDQSAPNQRTLTESDEQRKQRTDLADQFNRQGAGVTNLINEMRQVSEQSETAEPVLSQQLYDTLRSTPTDDLNKSLDSSAELVRHGLVPQAGPFEERARQTINDLQTRVDRAADSVLGDGTEALRLARRELDELNRQLNEGSGTNTNTFAGDGAFGTNAFGGRNALAGRGTNGIRGTNGTAARPGELAAGGNTNDANFQPGQGQNEQANANQPGGQRNGNRQGGGNRGGDRTGQPQDGQQIAGGGFDPNDTNTIQRLIQKRDQELRDLANGVTNVEGGMAERGGARAGGFRDGGAANFGGPGGAWYGGYWDTIYGPDYVDWTDRLRVVEEMIDDPTLSAEVARIRDNARALRRDFKASGKKPDWAVVTTQIGQPLAEVRARVDEELLKRQSKDALVPLDRDPVPSKYSELVRRYYEQLGKDNE